MTIIPAGNIPGYHADRKPEGAVAVSYGEDRITWRDLETRATQRARLFQSRGVKQGDFVIIALPNGTLFHETTFAVWKCGAIPTIVSAKLPPHEFEQIADLAKPRLIVGGDAVAVGNWPHLAADADISGFDPASFDAPVAPYWKAMTSGGSTGRPKIIVDHAPGAVDFGALAAQAGMGMEPGMVLLNPGPLYHNAPFTVCNLALFIGCEIVGQMRFDAEEALRLIDRYKVNWVNLVPTMMHRIWALPEETRDRYDISSLKRVWHMAAPCSAWLKEAWVHWLGGEKLFELYGGTEGGARTIIRGDEWLAKRGSVGRPLDPSKVRIIREDGAPAGPNEVGEIYFKRPNPEDASYHYIGAEAKTHEGGWESLGDLGHLDEDGYLFLADRRTDLILRGGANIYPAEIEAVLNEHPRVRSAVVIGLPCDAMGQRVHAIIQSGEGDIGDIHHFLAQRLAKYKLPESYETVDNNLWDDAGKVRRSLLRDERIDWLQQARPFRTMSMSAVA